MLPPRSAITPVLGFPAQLRQPASPDPRRLRAGCRSSTDRNLGERTLGTATASAWVSPQRRPQAPGSRATPHASPDSARQQRPVAGDHSATLSRPLPAALIIALRRILHQQSVTFDGMLSLSLLSPTLMVAQRSRRPCRVCPCPATQAQRRPAIFP